MIEFRPLAEDNLALEEWLNRPHVRRWWRDDIDESLTEYRAAIEGREPTDHCIVVIGEEELTGAMSRKKASRAG
jgi:hypothetical protein